MPDYVFPGISDRYASYFATYEGIKRFLLWRDRNKEDGIMPSPAMVMLKTAASGAAAGVMAWLPVYPGELEYRSDNNRLVGFGPNMTSVRYLYLCHSGVSQDQLATWIPPMMGRADCSS